MAASQATRDYQRAQVALRAMNYRDVVTLWRLLDGDRLDQTFPEFAAATLRLVKIRREMSANLGRRYIAAQRVGVLGSAPVVSTPELPTAEVLMALRIRSVIAVKKSMSRNVPIDRAMRSALVLTMGAVDKFVGDGGRDLILESVRLDPECKGWIRRTLGTCDYCAKKARGEHVKSDTADFPRHDHCGCQPEPAYKVEANNLQPEEPFVQKILGLLDSGDVTEDQLKAMLTAAETKPLSRLNIETALARRAPEKIAKPPASAFLPPEAAPATAKAIPSRVTLPDGPGRMDASQYEAFTPGRAWSAEQKAAINVELKRTENGRVLADSLEKFQDGGSIARLRASVDTYLRGESLNPTSRARAEAIVDMLRHAPTEWAPDTLYRGMSVKGSLENVLAKYRTGDPLDLNLTSFSSDRKVATKFQSMTATKGSTRVMVELVGEGKRALPIQNFARDRRLFQEKEWISGGRYEVIDAKKTATGVLVRIRQVGTL